MTAEPLILYEADPKAKTSVDPVSTAPEPVQTIVRAMTNLKHKLPIRDVDDIPAVVSTWRSANAGVELSSIDLVAHGTAGRLSVGFTSTMVEVAVVRGSTVYYVLDSNPKVYQVLRKDLEPVVSSTVPLRLLGCNTATHIKGYGLDGRVLLLALANMLDGAVYGTTTPIGIADFGPDGFIDRGQLSCVQSDKCLPVSGSYDPATCCQPPPSRHSTGSPPPRITEGVSKDRLVPSSAVSSLLGRERVRPYANRPLIRKVMTCFEEEGVHYPEGDGLLALVELRLRRGDGQQLELLDTGQFLRWRRPDGTVLFQAKRSGGLLPGPDLGQVLGRFAPWWCVSSRPR